MHLRSDRGSAFVELAVVTPILLVLAFALADYARAYHVAMQLEAMARAGAQFGAVSLASSGNTAGMISVAEGASNVAGVTAQASRFCYCLNDPPFAPAFIPRPMCLSDAPCGGGTIGHLAVYVQVDATTTFNTVTRFPGIPGSFDITRRALMRVPN